VDVLERVAADDGVARQMRIALVVEILDERDSFGRGAGDTFEDNRGIDADAAATRELAHEQQELPFAAADLEHILPLQVVPVDPHLRELVRELSESRREALGFLVAIEVALELGLVRLVGDETAAGAERESELSPRKRLGFLACCEQAAAVDRHVVLLVEDLERTRATGGAAVVPQRISGLGTGTMNRPPRPRYSLCCSAISSL
jgi:hypothetical protein